MQFYESFWLGLMQGISEMLPLSSNGHSRIMVWILGHEGDPSLYWNCIAQLFGIGATLALIVYYFADIVYLAKKNKKLLLSFFLGGLVSFLGAFLIGFLLKDFFVNKASMTLIMIVLALTGIVLLNGAKFFKEKSETKLESLSNKQVLSMSSIGILGGIPGMSFTLPLFLAARINGLNARRAIKTAHLIMIPALIGINIVRDIFVLSEPESLIHNSDIPQIVVANIISFAGAYIALYWLNRYLEKHNNFRIFGYYRILLATVMLIFILLK